MNALNLLSSRVIGQSAPATRPRSISKGNDAHHDASEEQDRGRSHNDDTLSDADGNLNFGQQDATTEPGDGDADLRGDYDEKQPLLAVQRRKEPASWRDEWKRAVKRIVQALTAILGAVGAPILYLAQCFYTEDGKFTVIPRPPGRRKSPGNSTASAVGLSSAGEQNSWESEKPTDRVIKETKLRRSYSSDLLAGTSDSESDQPHAAEDKVTAGSKYEPEGRRSSIRIKDQSDPALKKRKQKRGTSPLTQTAPLTIDNIKSPTSPSPLLKVTRYPRAPRPPRPLIPRRQPSYSNLMARTQSRHLTILPQQKTLILDLDETLIHSLAKGGRMSSGHMVEVKLNAPVALAPPQLHQPTPIIGPQHPILYYVHKRPHCDEFLRKVCKWFKLVVFTASVQEYADPVIDWLEQERKYFAGRYYRQHCTFRNGAYIKDLSSIEPDLSKVIILDNSPVSYFFHEDNAIPIEGWINDPTDNDLLHLIPMLEALQYVTDVRALLALRRGEAEAT